MKIPCSSGLATATSLARSRSPGRRGAKAGFYNFKVFRIKKNIPLKNALEPPLKGASRGSVKGSSRGLKGCFRGSCNCCKTVRDILKG